MLTDDIVAELKKGMKILETAPWKEGRYHVRDAGRYQLIVDRGMNAKEGLMSSFKFRVAGFDFNAFLNSLSTTPTIIKHPNPARSIEYVLRKQYAYADADLTPQTKVYSLPNFLPETGRRYYAMHIPEEGDLAILEGKKHRKPATAPVHITTTEIVSVAYAPEHMIYKLLPKDANFHRDWEAAVRFILKPEHLLF